MNGRNLLMRIKTPATLEFCKQLPESLDDGAHGGFHPCGLFDFIIDSISLEWTGIQFYLSSRQALQFRNANPRLDTSVAQLKEVGVAFIGDEFSVKNCERNKVSHVLQLLWAKAKQTEIIPALEAFDNWYAVVDSFASLGIDDRFSPSRQFTAIGVMLPCSTMEQYGFSWPSALLKS